MLLRKNLTSSWGTTQQKHQVHYIAEIKKHGIMRYPDVLATSRWALRAYNENEIKQRRMDNYWARQTKTDVHVCQIRSDCSKDLYVNSIND